MIVDTALKRNTHSQSQHIKYSSLIVGPTHLSMTLKLPLWKLAFNMQTWGIKRATF